MKKASFYTTIFVLGLFLQFTIAQYMSIRGAAPNVALIMLLIVALLRGAMAGQMLGFFWGLTWDVYSIDLFGCHAFVFTAIGFLAGKLSRKWDESKPSSQIVLVFIASILYWLLIFFCYRIFNPEVYTLKLNYIIVIQPFYNALIAPVVFKIFIVTLDLLGLDYESRV